jgi:hypothetical protein
MVTNSHKQVANKPNKSLNGRARTLQKLKNKPTIKISLCLKSAHLTPLRECDTFQGPSENKSQDRLIGVDFLNLTCEGLLLGIQVEGLAC